MITNAFEKKVISRKKNTDKSTVLINNMSSINRYQMTDPNQEIIFWGR